MPSQSPPTPTTEQPAQMALTSESRSMGRDASTAWHTTVHPATVCAMTPTSDRPPALTLRAAWERAGISRSTLYREINAGRLKTHTIATRAGTKQLIEVEEFESWLREFHPYQVKTDPDPKQEK